MMSDRQQALCGLLMLVVAFAAGRWSVGASEVKTTIDTTANQEKQVDKDTSTHSVTTITKAPDGTVSTTITTDKNTIAKIDTQTQMTQHVEQTITPPKINTLNVSLLAAPNFSVTNPVSYGLSVSKQLLGPLTVGAFGLTNGTIGLSLGVNF